MILLAILLVAAQDGGVTARQTTLSVDEVLGGKKAKQSKTERDADRETRRHNEKMEKEFRRLGKGDSAFSLHNGRMGKARRHRPGPVRMLPPNANSY